MDPILPDDRDAGPAPVPSEAPAELSSKGAARRRLGLGASGIILTLASKPGMATNPMYCGSVSGWQSASTASRTKSNGICTGLSAGYYMNHSWPSNCSKTAMFSTIFPQGRNTFYTDSSCWTVLSTTGSSSDQWNLRRELMAAYLNAMSGRNAHPNAAELKAMWINYVGNGGKYVISSTGQSLTGEQFKNFLASTHDGI